jgi:hypothetical protein
MSGRARIKPSRPMSVIGMLVCIAAVIIGFSIVIPNAGLFGVVWTLFALFGAVYNAVNVFSERGISHEVVEFEDDLDGIKNEGSIESRLHKLESLKQKGLVSNQEYQQQREKILKEI